MPGLIDIKSLKLNKIEELLVSFGEPKYRAKQIFKWLHRGVHGFDEMTDISKNLRERLLQNCYISSATIEKKLQSRYDDTIKYLFRLIDGEYVEAVLMSYHHGWSMCISSQVGCKMGCTFCATGRGGFVRNLTASEMLSQITEAQLDNDIRISNIVLMGMGEPLDNFDNVIRFLELLSDKDGVCIGQRHVSVSTCGIVDRINQLAEIKPQFTLSVSLHAPNDNIRSRTMPINNRWGVDTLLSACKRYAASTGRRVSYEYALISGVNDSDNCALELASKLRGSLSHVNLIPVNNVEESGCMPPSKQRIAAFQKILCDRGVTATVRRTLGSDINASCGQLRRKSLDT